MVIEHLHWYWCYLHIPDDLSMVILQIDEGGLSQLYRSPFLSHSGPDQSHIVFIHFLLSYHHNLGFSLCFDFSALVFIWFCRHPCHWVPFSDRTVILTLMSNQQWYLIAQPWITMNYYLVHTWFSRWVNRLDWNVNGIRNLKRTHRDNRVMYWKIFPTFEQWSVLKWRWSKCHFQ